MEFVLAQIDACHVLELSSSTIALRMTCDIGVKEIEPRGEESNQWDSPFMRIPIFHKDPHGQRGFH